MKIPHSFKLLGHTVTVKHDDAAGYYESGRFGRCSFEQKIIKLVPISAAHPVSRSSLEHTYMHELVHMCLYHTGRNDLNDNEEFVDLLAGLLHQAIDTADYGPKGRGL